VRDRKELGRFLLGKPKERLELEDLESQRRGVMRPPPLWHLAFGDPRRLRNRKTGGGKDGGAAKVSEALSQQAGLLAGLGR